MSKWNIEWSLTRNLYAEAYRLQRLRARIEALAYQNPDKPDHALAAAANEIHPTYMDKAAIKAAIVSLSNRKLGDLYESRSLQRSRHHAKASGFAAWEKRVNATIPHHDDKPSHSPSVTRTPVVISLYRRFDENWLCDSGKLGRWTVEMDAFADAEMQANISGLFHVFFTKKTRIHLLRKTLSGRPNCV